MNGRIYDPTIARFLSADPTVQSPGNPQTLNRYSYAGNNPLTYTDPSGYLFGIGGWLGDKLDSIPLISKASDAVRSLWQNPYFRMAAIIIVAPYAWQAGFAYGMSAGTAMGLGNAGIGAMALAGAGASAGLISAYIASGGDFNAALNGGAAGLLTGGLYAFGALGAMAGSGINGYLQTGDMRGFARGFAAGGIPQDLGFSAQYNSNGLANVTIGVVRDGIRGGIISDSRDGIVPGIGYGQINNAVGHLVGFATTGKQPLFRDGTFYYRGSFWNDSGAITFGNVISAGHSGQLDPFINKNLLLHEGGHVSQSVALGAAYIPAQVLMAGYSLTVNAGTLVGDVRSGSYQANGGLGYYTHLSNPLENSPMVPTPWNDVYK